MPREAMTTATSASGGENKVSPLQGSKFLEGERTHMGMIVRTEVYTASQMYL